jgi:integrase/recombinase XerC
MQLVGRPELTKPVPKALPRSAIEALLQTVAQDRESKRQTDWAERDLAIILTANMRTISATALDRTEHPLTHSQTPV